MNTITVQITDNSSEIKKACEESVNNALEIIGLKGEGYAKLICPVDTGRLRNSITHEQEGKYTELIGTNVEYAPYVEMGTQRQKAQPYLKPAVEGHVDEYKLIAETVLNGE